MKEIIETELQRIETAMSAMETEPFYYLSSKWAVLCAEKNILEKVIAASNELTSNP